MSDYSLMSDTELYARLTQGDELAFTQIYNTYSKILFKTAHRILQERTISQDIVQNVFISLWQRRSEVQIDNLKAYLQQATRFSVFKAIRTQQHDSEFYSRLSQVTVDIIAEDPLLFKEQQQLIKSLIDTLPADCKEAFRLSREEDMTYKQIACLLGISEKTVEKRMSKSLKHLRHGLNISMCVAILSTIANH